MGGTLEFEDQLSLSSEEGPVLQKLIVSTGTEKPKNQRAKKYKATLLINAYMQNIPIEDPKLLSDQEYILMLAPRVLSYIVELSL